MMSDLDPEPTGEERKGRVVTESIRKALVTGLSAVFMTEEGIRSALSDLRLPKEAIGFLVSQTNNSRREVFRIVSDELKTFLRNVDVTGAVRKALSGMKLEMKAEIRFVDTAAGGEEPAAKPKARRKSRRRR